MSWGRARSTKIAIPAIASAISSRVAIEPSRFAPACRQAPILHSIARPCAAQLTAGWRAVSILPAQPSLEDRMTLTRDRRAELLAGCQLFKGIDADGLAGLADVATPVDF